MGDYIPPSHPPNCENYAKRPICPGRGAGRNRAVFSQTREVLVEFTQGSILPAPMYLVGPVYDTVHGKCIAYRSGSKIRHHRVLPVESGDQVHRFLRIVGELE